MLVGRKPGGDVGVGWCQTKAQDEQGGMLPHQSAL